MANAYTQLFVQVVYAVKGRQNFILPGHRETLQRYTTGVLQNDKHKMLAVFYMPDHVHFLVGLNPDIGISKMVLDVKRATTNFINEQRLTPSHFNWQKGYGAFSYSKSQVPDVVRYILEQEKHHRKRTFREEYPDILKKVEIEYDGRYLVEFYDE